MSRKIEIRMIEAEKAEFRVVAAADSPDSPQRYIEGYGVVYNREVELWPGYFESIRHGAFADCLKGREIKSFFNHNPDNVLSTTGSRPPLEITDNQYGLRFKSPVPPTSYGNDLIINVERGNVRGASFSFFVPDGGDIMVRRADGSEYREIVKAVIYEVGPVTDPAYPMTSAKVRSKEDLIREFEERTKPAVAVAEPESPQEPEASKSDTVDKSNLIKNNRTLLIKKLNLIERGVL